jgi:hypothetical protein
MSQKRCDIEVENLPQTAKGSVENPVSDADAKNVSDSEQLKFQYRACRNTFFAAQIARYTHLQLIYL